MFSELDYRRLCWHSRRGMLELDLLLMPFVQHHFKALDLEYQLLYKQLLESEDQDLFSWLMLRVDPPDRGLGKIVPLILEKVTRS